MVYIPNEKQRKELCLIFSIVFKEIRFLIDEKKYNQARILADIFHNIPTEMYGIGKWDAESFVESFIRYNEEFGKLQYAK